MSKRRNVKQPRYDYSDHSEDDDFVGKSTAKRSKNSQSQEKLRAVEHLTKCTQQDKNSVSEKENRNLSSLQRENSIQKLNFKTKKKPINIIDSSDSESKCSQETSQKSAAKSEEYVPSESLESESDEPSGAESSDFQPSSDDEFTQSKKQATIIKTRTKASDKKAVSKSVKSPPCHIKQPKSSLSKSFELSSSHQSSNSSTTQKSLSTPTQKSVSTTTQKSVSTPTQKSLSTPTQKSVSTPPQISTPGARTPSSPFTMTVPSPRTTPANSTTPKPRTAAQRTAPGSSPKTPNIPAILSQRSAAPQTTPPLGVKIGLSRNIRFKSLHKNVKRPT